LKVAERLRKDDVFGATCFVQVKTGGFQRHSRQTRLKQSTNDENITFETAASLMKSLTDALFDQGEVLRLIGVGVSGIDHGEYQQMGMDAWLRANKENQKKKEKQKKLDEMVKKIRMQYGEKAVMVGEKQEPRE
jgi:DNA polymerase-4